MNRRLRPAKSSYQIKEEQISFLLEKKIIIETKDKQLTETKKINRGQKTATRA